MSGHDETYGNTPGTYAGPGATPRRPYTRIPTRPSVYCRACDTDDSWHNQRRCATCGAPIERPRHTTPR